MGMKGCENSRPPELCWQQLREPSCRTISPVQKEVWHSSDPWVCLHKCSPFLVPSGSGARGRDRWKHSRGINNTSLGWRRRPGFGGGGILFRRLDGGWRAWQIWTLTRAVSLGVWAGHEANFPLNLSSFCLCKPSQASYNERDLNTCYMTMARQKVEVVDGWSSPSCDELEQGKNMCVRRAKFLKSSRKEIGKSSTRFWILILLWSLKRIFATLNYPISKIKQTNCVPHVSKLSFLTWSRKSQEEVSCTIRLPIPLIAVICWKNAGHSLLSKKAG